MSTKPSYFLALLGFLVCMCSSGLPSGWGKDLILADAEWAYLSDGSQPPPNWVNLEFDDTGWLRGNGRFGFGEDIDYGTEIASSPETITYYFRHEFEVDELPEVVQLTVLLDDGIRIYLNEKQILNDNLPPAKIDSESRAFGSALNGHRWHVYEVMPSELREGRNIIAVEVHNASLPVHDMGFALTLVGSEAEPLRPQATSLYRDLSFSLIANLGDELIACNGDGMIGLSADEGLTWRYKSIGARGFPRDMITVGDTVLIVLQDRREGWVLLSEDRGETWEHVFTRFVVNMSAVAHNGQRFVIVGRYGTILHSVDGRSWTGVDHRGEDLNDVCWTGSSFVAVGDGGTILVSSGGQSWHQVESGTEEPLYTVDSRPGIIVIGGNFSASLTSTADGETWENHDLPFRMDHVASIDPGFVAIDRNRIFTSVDGLTWDYRYIEPYRRDFTDVAGTDSGFLAVARGRFLNAKSDGGWSLRIPSSDLMRVVVWNGSWVGVEDRKRLDQNWTLHDNWVTTDGLEEIDLFAVAVGRDLMIGLDPKGGALTKVYQSLDGKNWVKSIELPGEYSDIVYAEDRFVALNGGAMYWTADGSLWETATGERFADVDAFAFNGEIWVGGGSGGHIWSSEDGLNWDPRESGVHQRLRDILWTGSKFVVVGEEGVVLTSRDGLAWEKQPLPTEEEPNLLRVAHGNGITVMGGEDGFVFALTPEGAVTSVAAGLDTDITRLAFHQDEFVIGSEGFVTSFDGISWTGENGAFVGKFNGSFADSSFGYYFIFGDNGFLARFGAADPSRWLPVVTPSRANLSAMTRFRGRLHVVSQTGEIFASDDGLSWQKETSPTTGALHDIVSNDEIAVAVGYELTASRNIWYSEDGVAWEAAENEMLPGVYLTKVLADDDKFVAVGAKGTIFASDDGIHWTTHESGTESDLIALAHDGEKFVAVAKDGEVICSGDATDWTEVSEMRTNLSLRDFCWSGTHFIAAGEVLHYSRDGVSWLTESQLDQFSVGSLLWDEGKLLATGSLSGRSAIQWYYPQHGPAPFGSYTEWIEASEVSDELKAFTADADGDGVANGLAYAFGAGLPSSSNELQNTMPRVNRDRLQFSISPSLRADLRYFLESNSSLRTEDWVELAFKDPGGSWTGTMANQIETTEQNPTTFAIALPASDLQTMQYFRIRVELIE